MPKYFNEDDDKGTGGSTITPEVQKLIDEALAEKSKVLEQEFQKKFNESEKGLRLRLQKEAEKEKMSAEEKAKADIAEQLSNYEKQIKEYQDKEARLIREKAISEAKLPKFFENDKRIIDAKNDDLPSVIKTITKEYQETINAQGRANTTTPNTSANKQSAEEIRLRRAMGLKLPD